MTQIRTLCLFHKIGYINRWITRFGLTDQTADPLDRCRILKTLSNRKTFRIGVAEGLDFRPFLSKYLHFWTIFFYTPFDWRLDRLIKESALGICEVSHVCHNPKCLVIAHLEWCTSRFNEDRTNDKNNVSRGGCRAIDSLHWFYPCLLPHTRPSIDLGPGFPIYNKYVDWKKWKRAPWHASEVSPTKVLSMNIVMTDNLNWAHHLTKFNENRYEGVGKRIECLV